VKIAKKMSRFVVWRLGLALFAAAAVFVGFSRQEFFVSFIFDDTPLSIPPPTRPNSVVMAFTTFLAQSGNLEEISGALESFFRHNSKEQDYIDHFLVVNEWSEVDTSAQMSQLSMQFPKVTFFQKTKYRAGQAASLNLIMKAISPFKYLILWEKSWACSAPFILRAMDVMESTPVDQLQFTDAWRDVDPDCMLPSWSPSGNPFNFMLPENCWQRSHEHTAQLNNWFFFSLQPAITRVASVQGLKFDERLDVDFEQKFGLQWKKRGAQKAFIDPPVAARQAINMLL